MLSWGFFVMGKESQMKEFQFQPEEDGSLSLESAVFQALGAASMCWDETPHGVFDSTMAQEIGEKLLIKIHEITGMNDCDHEYFIPLKAILYEDGTRKILKSQCPVCKEIIETEATP